MFVKLILVVLLSTTLAFVPPQRDNQRARSWQVILTVCNPAAVIAGAGTDVQELKNLLAASVQSVVALNTLVTSQTQRISELMLTMSSNKMQIDDMGLKYNLALRKIEGLEEAIGALKTESKEQEEKLQELEVKDQAFEAKDQEFEEKNQEFEAKDQEFEAKNQEFEAKNQEFEAKNQEFEAKNHEFEVKNQAFEEKDQEFEQKLQELEVKDQELEVKDQQLKSEIDHYGNPVTVLNGEEATGDSQCAKVCSGTTGRTSSNWIQQHSTAIKMTVDISGCGFTQIPTITTSLENGAYFNPPLIGGSSVVKAYSTQFTVYIYRREGNLPVSTAAAFKLNMEWIAVGFTC